MTEAINTILQNRFSKDSLITIATCQDNVPFCRTVDAIYDQGSFYVITYARSNKMKQITLNPKVAISGEWFTGHGRGINRGYFGNPENKIIADQLRQAFSVWIDNGHNDFTDQNTIILEIQLTDGVLFSKGKRYSF